MDLTQATAAELALELMSRANEEHERRSFYVAARCYAAMIYLGDIALHRCVACPPRGAPCGDCDPLDEVGVAALPELAVRPWLNDDQRAMMQAELWPRPRRKEGVQG